MGLDGYLFFFKIRLTYCCARKRDTFEYYFLPKSDFNKLRIMSEVEDGDNFYTYNFSVRIEILSQIVNG